MKTIRCGRERLSQGEMVLVNREHPVCAAGPVDLIPVDAAHPAILLRKKAALLLDACLQAAGGKGRIVPVSGFRSRADQQEIWDDSLAKNGGEFTRSYVALPDCSEHQTGLAIDLGKAAGQIDFIRPSFPYDGICGVFRKAAARYGFIERYEREWETVTGISHEPWHFRYVGVPHAQIIRENFLCLEKYTAFLRERPRSCALGDGMIAQVFYVPCTGEETVVEVPDGCCQISGDNDAGFIVTAWGRAI